ncbi:heavy-metal-associated domain-containing protein [Collinsella sp. AGMB00827]|uniref:Heavy-metal-associated domain-containing protein n=1 Tax=Collinsella ureilytica TaxID=2869515 RepID=A0ABS7MHQ2_9ACTN|nr:heavy metal-associated domain-containing protein [Collinsella urealyticum]MBY4796889.1 heavy-metal-associated domain-containing protein [Collinsella urealyticum]
MEALLTPGNIVVALIVLAALIVGGRKIFGGIQGSSSCCGARDVQPRRRRVQIEDTDENNYPYQADLLIGGMSCEGCVQTVEAALCSLPGIWATVDLKQTEAHIRSKHPISLPELEAAVKSAGYYVAKI